jgi:hypothetical protein
MQDPEIAIKRAILTYQLKGYSDDWIEKRVRSIVARKELCREWQKRGIKEGQEYAALSNVISQETFGVGVERHKRVKGLTRHSSPLGLCVRKNFPTPPGAGCPEQQRAALRPRDQITWAATVWTELLP